MRPPAVRPREPARAPAAARWHRRGRAAPGRQRWRWWVRRVSLVAAAFLRQTAAAGAAPAPRGARSAGTRRGARAGSPPTRAPARCPLARAAPPRTSTPSRVASGVGGREGPRRPTGAPWPLPAAPRSGRRPRAAPPAQARPPGCRWWPTPTPRRRAFAPRGCRCTCSDSAPPTRALPGGRGAGCTRGRRRTAGRTGSRRWRTRAAGRRPSERARRRSRPRRRRPPPAPGAPARRRRRPPVLLRAATCGRCRTSHTASAGPH